MSVVAYTVILVFTCFRKEYVTNFCAGAGETAWRVRGLAEQTYEFKFRAIKAT